MLGNTSYQWLAVCRSEKQCVCHGNSVSDTRIFPILVSPVINLWLRQCSASLSDGCLSGHRSLWEVWAGPRGISLQGSKAVVQEDVVAVFPSQNTVI